ncbi:MAG: glycerophosphodiester phosphodiesterase [Lachnospiraceae bacterium]|nr:glycerophosphodiester phosphodiesterase [Lachnospiraceae bacterium]
MRQTKPLVWAHRGASGYAPENTLAAFQMAADMGADGVELDIQLTKDDQIVVIHDETIDRTSDGKGYVRDYTLEELRRFNYNKTKPEVEWADIPTMAEVFDLLKPTGLFINIEIKTGIYFYPQIEEKILALAKEKGMEDRVCYSSFNHYTVKRVQELEPSATVGFLYADGPIDMPEYGVKHGVQALHPALYNLQFEGFVEECHKKGLLLNVWTVNEEEHIRKCCDLGVNAIITNYPDLAREIVDAG